MTRDDPQLGRVRECVGCHVEWPFDGEFWYIRDGKLNPSWPAKCIACCAEYFAAKRRLYMNIAKGERIHMPAGGDRCGETMMQGKVCGRRPGHADGHRSVEAVTYDRNRSKQKRMAA